MVPKVYRKGEETVEIFQYSHFFKVVRTKIFGEKKVSQNGKP